MTSDCIHNVRVLVLIETSREYGRGLLRGICRYNALHKHWQIEHRETGLVKHDVSKSALRVWGRPPDGIVMRDYRGSPALLKKGIPIVFASHLHKDIRGGHRIVTDDRAIGRMAAVHLLERGFSRFAFVGCDGMYWSRQRCESFAQTVAKAGHTCTVFEQARQLRLREWSKERKDLADWLGTLARPVGVMACNDDRARQVVEACAMAGLGIPEDIALVGVDNDEFVCSLSNPPVSSVALGAEDAGYRAAALLDRLMKAAGAPLERGGKRRTPPNNEKRAASDVQRHVLVSPVAVVTRQSSDTAVIEDPAIAKAVQFIRANCRRPIQIADVLRAVPLSRRSLYDRFRRGLGCTVHQYIKRARVAEIEQMLLGTSDSIGQIAEVLGFPGAEHVALYFRSVTGMNPHAFRAQCIRH